MKIFLAGTAPAHREKILIDAKVRHRLISFANKADTLDALRKWGLEKRPERKRR